MKKLLGPFVLIFVIFFYIYPQALPIMGSSFILGTGVLGLVLYFYNGRPFTEIITIVLGYLPFVVTSFISGYMNYGVDAYLINYTKTQVAWVFSAYLIVYLYFYIHPKGNYVNLLSYIVIAILIQCIISIAMYQNPAVDRFFSSIQMADSLALYKRELTEGKRLLGFGIAFFGAGIICGAGLIITSYIIVKKKMNIFLVAIWSAIYSFIFFVGLLSARTTLVGLGASLILAVCLFLTDKKISKVQFLKFLALTAGFASIGYTLCYVYFPEFADWAFEAFINYQQTGELRTYSSDSLEYMFILPSNFHQWIFGSGTLEFFGSDVGFTRLLFYGGLPATIAFFFYQFVLAKLSFTKDIAQNLMVLVLVGYSLALNVKGLADSNCFLCLMLFYFLHYKYFIFTPQINRIGKFNSTQLRDAVQSPPSRRRIQGNV